MADSVNFRKSSFAKEPLDLTRVANCPAFFEE
jgi:hypothetical protein